MKLPIVLLSACLLHGLLRAEINDNSVPTTQPAAEWASQLPEKWPQLVLTNDAEFEGHTALHGASGFIIQMPGGKVVFGTAKHLIKAAGGVDPPILLQDLDHVLKQWRVFPRTQQGKTLEVKGLAESNNFEHTHDWLLLNVVDNKFNLPATPLVPRSQPVAVGETIYLIGVPYTDRHAPQRIYKGMVTARPKAHYFTYDFEPAVAIRGFSGAPIVDAHGLLVGHGVQMGSGLLKQKDGLEVEFGGEDASLAVELWQHRNEPPPTKAADVLKLIPPADWKPRPTTNPVVVASLIKSPLVLMLTAQPRAQFTAEYDLQAWAKGEKADLTKRVKRPDREETVLHFGSINSRRTMEYEISETSNGVAVRMRIIYLEADGFYCKFVCTAPASVWDDAQGQFDDVIKTLN